MLEIHEQKDSNGYWFMVYLNGQPIDGFRDPGDAHLFGRWFASRDSTTQYEYVKDVCSQGTNS
jgi:hypothetical protein